VNKTEAWQDKSDGILTFTLIFLLFLADDTILVLSQRSFWLKKINGWIQKKKLRNLKNKQLSNIYP
jgi:hypothetical protein